MNNLILPRVKSCVEADGTWHPERTIGFCAAEADTFGQNAFRAAELFLPGHYLVRSQQAEVVLKRLDHAPHAEWYRLTATAGGVTLEYADARGAINAVASLAQMILDGAVHACVIEDWPDYPFRAVMLDLAHDHREPFQDVLDIIVHMALAKYNVAQINLLCEGLPYASDAVPELRGSPRRNGRRYTKAQMAELVALCRLFAIEAIPMLQIPAHAKELLATFPQFACEVPEDHTSKWCLCPGSEGVFEMYERLIAEVCQLFPGKYLHMGGDELEFQLQPQLNQLCYWRECPKCRKLREDNGLADIREQFYYVVMRIYEYARANGRVLMMWNDQIDISKPCPLPKDILIHFWRVAGDGRGPVEGCSMEAFARQGYQIVNSFFPQTYVDFNFYLTEEKLCRWTPVTDPALYEEGHPSVLGSALCAWAYGKRERYYFYDYTIQPSLPLFADRLWCSDPVVYDREYRENVYKFMFGRNLSCDLYPVFGGIIPPRWEETHAPLTHKKPEDVDDDYLALCMEELAKPGPGGIYQNLRVIYIKLLQNIALQKVQAATPAAVGGAALSIDK
ncbi:MAG: family 20 glycosylhydrolase [Oscillospiraceae bacterium]|nr:family 20 glycosylhydrolase [Oscillospiraceae bacterium]